MYTNFLLFAQSTFLGEMQFENGVLRMSVLNKEGDEILGERVVRWNLSGIPMMSFAYNEDAHGAHQCTAYEAMVSPKSPECQVAVLKYLRSERLHVVDITSPVLRAAWEQLLRFPFEAVQRYRLISALAQKTDPEVKEWMREMRNTFSDFSIKQ